jgi:hypothetical protein
MPRTLTAAAIAIVASAVVYGMVLAIAMRGLSSDSLPWAMLFAPGLLWGVLFAVLVLVPLSFFVRRFGDGKAGLLGGLAIAVWCVVSAMLFASRGLSVAEVVGNSLLVLPAGLAAVVAFVLVARRPSA